MNTIVIQTIGNHRLMSLFSVRFRQLLPSKVLGEFFSRYKVLLELIRDGSKTTRKIKDFMVDLSKGHVTKK